MCGLACSGCSFDLPRSSSDGGLENGGDHLTLSLTAATIKRAQRVPFRVTVVYPDQTEQDVTGSATYESSAPGVAAVGAAGQLEGGAQAGTATITARFGQARSATIAVTVLDKDCHPVINELQTGGATSSADEWIELVNPCAAAIDVAGWTLVYRTATTTGGPDSAGMLTLSGSLPAGAIRLFAGQDYGGVNDGRWAGGASGIMGQISGAVALRMGAKDVGVIADAVSYGGAVVSAGHPFTEGSPLPLMANGRPAQRLPYDGRDQDDAAVDFMLVPVGGAGTPGAPNVK